jgi:hypothetical protein
MTYKVASVCLNGHLIGFYEVIDILEDREGDRFCQRCGKQAITTCLHCNRHIRGEPSGITWMAADALPPYSIPAFCHACGKPYPWMIRMVEEVKEQIELEQSLSADDKAALTTDIEDIAHNSPRAENAAKRAKAIFQKVGGAVGSTLRDVFVSVASDFVKKILLP